MVMSRTHGEAEIRTLKERRGYSALSVAQSAGRWGSGRRALGRRRHKYWGWGVRSAPKCTGSYPHQNPGKVDFGFGLLANPDGFRDSEYTAALI